MKIKFDPAFTKSGSYEHLLAQIDVTVEPDSEVIAVKPVRVTTSNQERENQRDAGQPETETQIEWLVLLRTPNAFSPYLVGCWKHEGQLFEEAFSSFETALHRFNTCVIDCQVL